MFFQYRNSIFNPNLYIRMLSLRHYWKQKIWQYNNINAQFINQFSTNLTHMSDFWGGQNGTQIQIQIFCVKSTHLVAHPSISYIICEVTPCLGPSCRGTQIILISYIIMRISQPNFLSFPLHAAPFLRLVGILVSGPLLTFSAANVGKIWRICTGKKDVTII